MKAGTAPLRAWAGIAVAALLCLILSFQLFSTVSAYYRQNPDPHQFSKQERRFARLRAELPAGSVLGYFTDIPSTVRGRSGIFFTVMYTVAPHLLVPDGARDKPALVLGNFSKPPDLSRIEQEKGLKLRKDFGGGVMLFTREGK